jgi:hypothetical protein
MADDDASESNAASSRVLQFRRKTDRVGVGGAQPSGYVVQLVLELLRLTAEEVESTNDILNELWSRLQAVNDTVNLNITVGGRSLKEFSSIVSANTERRTEITGLLRKIYQLLVDPPLDTDARLHPLLAALDAAWTKRIPNRERTNE